MKYLLLLALIAIVWRFWLKSKQGDVRQPEASASEHRMLQCRHCQIHFPDNEAIVDEAGAAYCCEAHKQAAQRRPKA